MFGYGSQPAEEVDDGSGDGSPPNVLSILPGGHTPSPIERQVAFLVLGALAFLILIRRGFPRAK